MLKKHVETYHSVHNSTQTDMSAIKDQFVQCAIMIQSEPITEDNHDITEVETEFVKYPCCYCGINVANEYHLCEHRVKCRGTHNLFSAPGLPPDLPPRFLYNFPPQFPPSRLNKFLPVVKGSI